MRFKPKYVQAWVDKKSGDVYIFFRRPGFKRVPLPGPLGSREFWDAYHAALAQPHSQIGTSRSKPGTVAAAVAAYVLSPQFNGLADGTRVARRAILQRFRDDHGDKPIAAMPSKFIALLLGTKKPHAARNYFKAIRALCQFAVEVEMIPADPTQGIKLPKVKTNHRRPWTDVEIEQFERAHPISSRARLALALGLYTIQRLGDVRRMGPQHIQNGELSVQQGKTGARLTLPVLPELQTILDGTPCQHMTFLVTKSGRPYTSNDLSGQFREWCNEAGLSNGCTFHGLRATGCTRLADAGFSAHVIQSWSGHMTLKEVERYTKSADQKRLARSVLANRSEQTTVKSEKPKQVSL